MSGYHWSDDDTSEGGSFASRPWLTTGNWNHRQRGLLYSRRGKGCLQRCRKMNYMPLSRKRPPTWLDNRAIHVSLFSVSTSKTTAVCSSINSAHWTKWFARTRGWGHEPWKKISSLMATKWNNVCKRIIYLYIAFEGHFGFLIMQLIYTQFFQNITDKKNEWKW